MTTITNLTARSRSRPITSFKPLDVSASLSEIIRDVNQLVEAYNAKVVPALSALPLGSADTDNSIYTPITDSLDGITNGISGDQIWTDNTATSASSSLFFFGGRKLTIKETITKLNSRFDDAVAALQVLINTESDGISNYTKAYIGLKAFDAALTSSGTSIDGKVSKVEDNLDQLAADLAGPNYTLDNDGDADLTYSALELIEAILALHNGTGYNSGLAFPNTITLSHSFLTSDIELDAGNEIPQTYVDTSSSYTELNRAASLSNLEDDLNRIRWEITHLRGSTAFNNDTGVEGYSGGAESLAGHLNEQGSGTPSATNPHGLDLANLESWPSIIAGIMNFTGMDSDIDGVPLYTAHGPVAIVADGDSLEEAVQKLDEQLVLLVGGQPAGQETLRSKDFSKMTPSGPNEATVYTTLDETGTVVRTLAYAGGSDEYAMALVCPPTDTNGNLPSTVEVITSWLPSAGATGDSVVTIAYSTTVISSADVGYIHGDDDLFAVTWGATQKSVFTLNASPNLNVIAHNDLILSSSNTPNGHLAIRIARTSTDPAETFNGTLNLVSVNVIWRW